MKHNSRTIVALALAIALALIAAACGSDGESTSTVTEPNTTGDSTTTTVSSDSSAPTTVSNDTSAPAASTSGLEVIAVDFVGGNATVANSGSEAVELSGHQLCNRPTYVALPDQTLGPGETIDVSIGGLTQDGGEVALYTSADFGSSDALVDYVTWGSGGGRLSVAEEAGQWSGSPATAEGDSLTLIGASGTADGWGQ